jgi:hypothetical protein
MGTVKVYRFRTPYNSETDSEPVLKRMGTRKFIEEIHGTVIEETELEVDSSKVDDAGKTEIGFKGSNWSGALQGIQHHRSK